MIVIPNHVRVLAVMFVLALAGGLVTLALLAKPSQAQPSTPNENRGATSEWFPISFEIGLPDPDDPSCGRIGFGEEIEVEGTLHVLTHFFADEEGGVNLNSHYNAQNMKGVGVDPITSEPTGTEYVFVTSGAAVTNYIPSSGQFNTGSVDLNLIIQKGPGTTEDETLTKQVTFFTAHYILYPDGTVKVENVEGHRQCV